MTPTPTLTLTLTLALGSHRACDKGRQDFARTGQLNGHELNGRPGDSASATTDTHGHAVLRAAVARGTAVLMDLRLLHRGGRNRSPDNRPVMYMSFVREWWRDGVNFHRAHTRRFDGYDKQSMKVSTCVGPSVLLPVRSLQYPQD